MASKKAQLPRSETVTRPRGGTPGCTKLGYPTRSRAILWFLGPASFPEPRFARLMRGRTFLLVAGSFWWGANTGASQLDHDLAPGSPLGKVIQCFLGLRERKHLVDHRLEALCLKQFGDFIKLSAIGARKEK